jgi:hypothetical protein
MQFIVTLLAVLATSAYAAPSGNLIRQSCDIAGLFFFAVSNGLKVESIL